MDRDKRGKTVTTSPLTKKRKSTPSLSKAFLVFADQLGYIIKVFYVVPPVPLWAVASPANEIFNGQTFTSFDCPLVEQAVDLKRFKIVSITVDKHSGGMMWAGAPKRVVERFGSRFKLRYQENRVDSPVIWYFELVGKTSYPFFDLKRAYVLLG